MKTQNFQTKKIILRQGLNKIILDEWLSTMVKKPAYLLQLIHANLKQKDLPKGKIFIWSKISVGDIRRLICLQKLGFYIVDTNIQFSLSKKISFVNNFNLRFAKPSDESGVRALAKNAFKFSKEYSLFEHYKNLNKILF